MINKEVEEILDYLKDDKWDYYPSDGIPYKVFLMEERDKLLDYITNLQKENEKVHKDFNELSEKYFFTKTRCEKAIEYIKTCNPDVDLNSMFLNENYISNYGANDLLKILNGGDE